MTKQTIGFGIIGCGDIARSHAEAIHRAKNAELKAVYDIFPEKAQTFGQTLNVPAYSDLDAFLDRKDVQVVSVCTPSKFHYDATLAAARAGKHVLTEKPMATEVAPAEEMIRVCREEGVKLGVIFQNRFDPPVQKVKRLLAEEVLGHLTMADAHLKDFRAPAYYAQADWRGTWATDGGGPIMIQGIHYFDMLLWMAGPVAEVAGFAARQVHPIEVEDTLVATLRYRSGALGVVESATNTFGGGANRLELHSFEGTIILENNRVTKFVTRGKDGRPVDRRAEFGFERDQKEEWVENHRRQIEDMADAVFHDREPAVNGEEGIKVLKVIKTIYRAVKENHPVAVDPKIWEAAHV
ncbi:MAG: Gfo/Idh/MocA family oxidoreductase [Calditrichaeota bacterium]|nr:Gfo/Idh/MocA family oxidoreductase [Calditrichota bacterium]